jgi:hypothetical protein
MEWRPLSTGECRGRSTRPSPTLDLPETLSMADPRATLSKSDRAALENRKMTLLTRSGPRQELVDGALEGCQTAVIPGSCRAWSECERAQEPFRLNRRLTAQEALAFGLVSRLAPSGAVESEAARWSMAALSTAAMLRSSSWGSFLNATSSAASQRGRKVAGRSIGLEFPSPA